MTVSVFPSPLPVTEPARQLADIERRLEDDRNAAERRSRRLGDTLLAMGLLTERHVRQITQIQEDTGEPFGRIAIRKGFVKPSAVQAAIGVQFGFLRESDHPIRIPKRLVVMRKPHSKEAEQIRLMRTRLITSCEANELKTISVIGMGRDQGAVELAANLGATFAQLHRRVLILDANLRAPSLGQFFSAGVVRSRKNNVGNGVKGLSDYLSGRARFDDVIQQSLVTRLDLLTEGQRAYNPQILLGSEAFDGLLDRAKRDYDIILLLSTGYGPIADGQFVWQKSDSALVVARKNKTREDELKQLAAILYDLDTTMLGAVLAK